jgi:N-acetylmuramoyl-L-alanine amidase
LGIPGSGDKMRKILTREEWRKRRHRKRVVLIALSFLLLVVIIALTAIIILEVVNRRGNTVEGKEAIDKALSNGVVIEENYLTPNDYSRPQTPLKKVNAIVIHYTANPGTSAANNRSYFEGLARKKTTYASSHYIIGLEGEVLQCVPLNEISFASNDRNADTISIENCHEDETGKFNEATYQSLVALTASLCVEFGLKEEDIIRHYDVTGKLCPLYYVENEEEWLQFRREVMAEADIIKKNRKEGGQG